MRLTHEFALPASPPECWRLLTDVRTVAGCLPGLTVGSKEERLYPGTFRAHLGPLSVEYAGSGRFLRRSVGARAAVFRAEGSEVRGSGIVEATISWRLVPDGPLTRARVDTELELTGRPGQLSQAIIQDASDQLVAGLVRCLETRLPPQDTGSATLRPVTDGAERPSALARYGGFVAGGALGVLVGLRLGRERAAR